MRQNEEEWLQQIEDNWIHGKRDYPGSGSLPFKEFMLLTHHITERRGKRVYDIVTLTVQGTLTNRTYFDVTRFTSGWPKGN